MVSVISEHDSVISHELGQKINNRNAYVNEQRQEHMHVCKINNPTSLHIYGYLPEEMKVTYL